jgi:hypothetical protein
MKKLVKVKDHPHLYRDEETGSIINCDTISYNQRINRINSKEAQKKEIDDMKNDIQEIKNLLKDFLKK